MLKFLGFLVVFVAIMGFAVPSIFLSESFASERTTTIAASPAEVRSTVGDFNTWDSWTVWNQERDPSMTRTITGTPGEVGHRMEWTSDKDGPGSIEITATDPARTTYVLQFGEMTPCDTVMHHEPNGEGATNVRWTMSGEIEGMPYWRWMGLLIPGAVGKDYEAGLANLKALLEGGAEPDAPGDDAGSDGSAGSDDSDGE